MISILEKFDKVAAAGLLAKAALSLAYAASPGAAFAADDSLQASIIEEARNKLGLKSDDFEESSIEKLADFLDAESDKLVSPPDERSVLNRLADRGDLPSDLYKIDISPNIKKLYGKGFPLEKKLIETTIRSPTIEQHFGKYGGPDEPNLVSLFVKTFQTKWPVKDFLLLVAAQRNGTSLVVNQSWRIYMSRVDLIGPINRCVERKRLLRQALQDSNTSKIPSDQLVPIHRRNRIS